MRRRSAPRQQNPYREEEQAEDDGSNVIDEVIKMADNMATNVQRLHSSPIYLASDVTLRSTCFDFVSFTQWYAETLKKYRSNADVDWHGISWEIASYMNRSICFVELDKPVYYVLSWHTIHKQTYWKQMLVSDFKTQFSGYPVTLISYKKKDGVDVMCRKDTNLYDVYFNSPVKRIHRDAVFQPLTETTEPDPTVLNLWMGYRWPVAQMREAAKCPVARQTCFDFFKLFFDVHCKKSPTLFNYCVDWYATKMRHPGRKLSTSITYYTKKHRCGKGWFVNHIGYLFGQHYSQTNNSDDVTGKFTSMHENVVLFFLDEAFFSGDKSAGSKLKSIITEKFQRFELKFRSARLIESCTSYNMATNDTGCIPGDPTDNRYLVLDVSEVYASNHGFFSEFSKRLHANNDAALKAIGWFLLEGWKITESFGETGQELPTTEMMLIQRSNNFGAHEHFFDRVLSQGFIVHPDYLLDNVYAFCPGPMRPHLINNVHSGSKQKQHNNRISIMHSNYTKFPQNLNLFPDPALPTNNAINESRYDPRDLTVGPTKLWSRVIALDDIMTAFDAFCVKMRLSTYGKNANIHMMKQKLAEFLSPSGTSLPVVTLRKIAGLVAGDARMVDNVKLRDLAYVVLPPLFQCRARFQEMVGKSFLRDDLIDLENEGEDQPEIETRAAQDMRTFQEKQRGAVVNDYDKPFPYTLATLCEQTPWPAIVSLIDPVTRMRRIRTRDERDAETQRRALVEIREGRDVGTMEQELQAWEVRKKRRVTAPPPPPPEPVYELQEGDLALFEPILEEIVEEQPVVVNNNNNNNNNNNDHVMLDELPEINLDFDFPDLLHNSFEAMLTQ